MEGCEQGWINDIVSGDPWALLWAKTFPIDQILYYTDTTTIHHSTGSPGSLSLCKWLHLPGLVEGVPKLCGDRNRWVIWFMEWHMESWMDSVVCSKVQLISDRVDLSVMVKGPMYLGISFLHGRHILPSLVDSQTHPGWKVGVPSIGCPPGSIGGTLPLWVSVPDPFGLSELQVNRWDMWWFPRPLEQRRLVTEHAPEERESNGRLIKGTGA